MAQSRRSSAASASCTSSGWRLARRKSCVMTSPAAPSRRDPDESGAPWCRGWRGPVGAEFGRVSAASAGVHSGLNRGGVIMDGQCGRLGGTTPCDASARWGKQKTPSGGTGGGESLRVTSDPLRRARNDDGDGNGCNDGGDHGVTVVSEAGRNCHSAEGHEDSRERERAVGVKSVVGEPSRMLFAPETSGPRWAHRGCAD
jgi:hypothetical protein